MLTICRKDFGEIQSWLHRNARCLELSQWRYYFEDGPSRDILGALTYYQNADGGFGHALEADNWNPHSSPYVTLRAAQILCDTDLSDPHNPMVQGIFKFLSSGVHYCDCGWNFSIPSNDAYPHAPWWTHSDETNEFQSIGLSASLSAFVLTYGDATSPLYHKALDEAGRLFGLLSDSNDIGDMGLDGYLALLHTTPITDLGDRYDIDALVEAVRTRVNAAIERDPAKWSGYCVRPSQFITSPESPFYAENADVVDAELDYLIKTRPPGAVWDINWSWFENADKYPDAFAISRNWWRAERAITYMRFLRSFERIDFPGK